MAEFGSLAPDVEELVDGFTRALAMLRSRQGEAPQVMNPTWQYRLGRAAAEHLNEKPPFDWGAFQGPSGERDDPMRGRQAEATVPLALGAMGGGTAFAPRGSLGIFGGRLAQTADHAALAKAEELAAKGAPREQIWNETGWFKGADDKWKFEIPDNAAVIGAKAQEELFDKGMTHGKAAGVLWHKELYPAYPELRNADMAAHIDPKPSGSYMRMSINGMSGPDMMLAKGPTTKDIRSVALHEMQHGIQSNEGFARGASVGEYARGLMFSKQANELKADLSQSLFGNVIMPPHEIIASLKYGDPAALSAVATKHGFESVDRAMAFLKQQDEMRTPLGQYRRTAGEVESRNVQKRMDMTPEQRKAAPPWTTEDVPRDQQIVRFGDAGPQAHMPLPPSFTERMDIGKTLAEKNRARGYATGKSAAGWDRKPAAAPEAGSYERLRQGTNARMHDATGGAIEDYLLAAYPGRYEGWPKFVIGGGVGIPLAAGASNFGSLSPQQ